MIYLMKKKTNCIWNLTTSTAKMSFFGRFVTKNVNCLNNPNKNNIVSFRTSRRSSWSIIQNPKVFVFIISITEYEVLNKERKYRNSVIEEKNYDNAGGL